MIRIERWFVAKRLAGLALLLGSVACGSSLPLAPSGSAPANAEYEEVPYPPPPAVVEHIPDRPRGEAVWVDGQWEWRGTRWAWARGGWVVPPPSSYFTRWELGRRADGTLVFLAASWRKSATGEVIEAPPFLARAERSRTRNTPR